MRPRLLTVTFGLLAAGNPALADQASVPGVSGASFVQGLLGLVLVIGLLVFAAWALRRLGGGSALGNARGLRVLSGLAVGPRERILLLEVGDTWLVVGVTSGQMRTLHTMAKGELPATATAGEVPAFAGWIRQFSGRRNDRV